MSSERQLLEERSPWWGEHIHRYSEVLKYLRGNEKILDLACGTGFGSDILSQHTGNEVIGGDIASEAIIECSSVWKRPNLKFAVLDGTQLPYNNEYFDIIVSFETIEHTSKYREMLGEFYRVLKINGIAFISTPNFPVNSPSGRVTNPYHIQEFTYNELDIILKEIFGNVNILGQKYSRYDEKKLSLGKTLENFFSIMGIRKLPYGFKNGVFQLFSRNPLYPTAKDYKLIPGQDEAVKCKTFFCVCRK